MKGRLVVIGCLLAILIGFVVLVVLSMTYTEWLATSPFNFGWVESGAPPLIE